MARPILSEFGPDSYKPQAEPASCGGVLKARDVMNYQPPTGPINQKRPGPGLKGGTYLGEGPRFMDHDPVTGSPGIHGTNYGNAGSQGRR